MSFFSKFEQNIKTSPTNSSVANLNANATFTGTSVSTLGVAGIQVALMTDQNCNLYVDQSTDGTNWDIVDSYKYYAGRNFGVTTQAVSSFVRVRVTNLNTATATTYFRLQTVLCPIVEALPRSLNSEGNLKVSIYGSEDEYGFETENTPMGEIRSVEPVRLVGASYEGNTLDTRFLVSGASGTGASISQSGGQLILVSGTASGATSWAYTNRRARYVGGTSNRYRSVRNIDAGTVNNTRRFGVGLVANYNLTITSATVVAGDVYTNNSQQFQIMISGTVTTAKVYGTGNPGAGAQTYTRVSGVGPATLTGSAFATTFEITDGAWYQYNGTTFGIRVMAGGALVSGGNIDSGAFNGNYGLTYTPPITATSYEMYYTSTSVLFSIGGVVVHSFTHTGTGVWSNSKSMHAFSDSLNTGTASSVSQYSKSATIYRLGKLETAPLWYYSHGVNAGTVLKYGPGRLGRIIVNQSANGSAISLYDAVSAVNPIALILISNTNTNNDIVYGLDFYNGLYVVVANAATDVTVVYE